MSFEEQKPYKSTVGMGSAPVKTERALRYNKGKPKLSFIFSAPNALEGLANVMEYGSIKYDRDNWLKGLPMTQVLDSMMRHIIAFSGGEDQDVESGLAHVDHILCNALFLSEFFHTNPEMDDRIGAEK